MWIGSVRQGPHDRPGRNLGAYAKKLTATRRLSYGPGIARQRFPGEALSTSAQIRQRLVDLGKKRASYEVRLAEARGRQAKKQQDAASYRLRAAKTSSPSAAESYLRQAQSAEVAALVEAKRMADESMRIAECLSKEAALNRDLGEVVEREARVEKRNRQRQEAKEERDREHQDAVARSIREGQEASAKLDRQRDLAALKGFSQQQIGSERARTQELLAASEKRIAAEMKKLRPPRVEPLRILYLTATPLGDLRVDEEIRRVKAGVRAATLRDLVRVEHAPAATASDLLDGLIRFKPHVVHFSGHSNAMIVEFDTGSARRGPGQQVAARTFARAIGAVDTPPTLVVLNACKSKAQLAVLLAAVPIAIGMRDSVPDRDAIVFAARFYTAVAEGQSIKSAFDLAGVQMEFDGLSGADLPILAWVRSIDPAIVKLVIRPR